MKRVKLFEEFIENSSVNEDEKDGYVPFDKTRVKRGDYVYVSKDVSNRPLGGIAQYGGIYDGQIKLITGKGDFYLSPQYVSIKKS
jgi:hypothetical protein